MKIILASAALAGALVLAVGVAVPAHSDAEGTTASETLRSASSFDGISDRKERSRAMFKEAGKVILNPRCVDCHPAGNSPLQGTEMRLHQPPVRRGDAGMGAPGMMCNTCHGPKNADIVAQAENIKSIPGNPKWQLAPIEMAWQGKSLHEVCVQIKDPKRNGGRDLQAIVDHMAHDDLVGWGWHPGRGRTPVPGTQKQFGDLIAAWVKTGAACPD